MIVVEDGTGLATAEAYASVAEATAYWAARPHLPLATAWAAATAPVKEGAIRDAATYLDGRWGALFVGARLISTQALEWPREPIGTEVVPSGIPQALRAASAELAARALDGGLVIEGSATGAIKRDKVGDAETEFDTTTMDRGASRDLFIGQLLRGLLGGDPNWLWR